MRNFTNLFCIALSTCKCYSFHVKRIRKFSFRSACVSTNLSKQCSTVEDIEHIASKLADSSTNGDVYLLKGDLGAGKTCFARAFIRERMQDPEYIVTSPTYLIDNTYLDTIQEDLLIHHLDLYRLPKGCDLTMIGIPEIFSSCICLIEWPQRMSEKDYPSSYLDISITIDRDETRTITMVPVGPRWAGGDRLQLLLEDSKDSSREDV